MNNRKINQLGINLIKKYESLHDGDLSRIGCQPKLCPADVWTIGYGRTLKLSNTNLKFEKDRLLYYKDIPSLGDLISLLDPSLYDITEKQAEFFLEEDSLKYGNFVLNHIKKELNDNQYSALTSLVYNIGENNFKTSSLVRKINSNASEKEIRDRWIVWNKARVKGNLKTLKGLMQRREEEIELYFKKPIS